MTVKIFGGVDVGYNETKAVTKSRRVQFPSVTGTPEQSAFGFGGDNSAIVLLEPYNVAVGQLAIEQSASIDARIDRGWLTSDKWHALALAALSEITTATSGGLTLVMGLPVSYFSDRETVKERIMGRQSFQRQGRVRQTLTVERCAIMPQPFGALFAEIMNDSGRVIDLPLKQGRVGVIDIGGKTTNLLTASNLQQINKESGSIDAGGWSVVARVMGYLESEYPALTLGEYELLPHIISRSINYAGKPVDLTDVVAAAVDALTVRIVGAARRLWNGSARLDAIIITGGGAHLCGQALLAEFPQARVVAAPVFANALGFWRFAQALNR